ncbi:MAG: transglutaminase family protein [Corynebacterium sp.]|uniref:transglutaminase family protein n=1 Tax=Corynebacterium sp. TaxID=1720 RepID=UPI003F9B6FEA
MTSTLRIEHITGFTYSDNVNDSFNEIRMSPLYTPQQLIRERTVNIAPRPWSTSFIDYWGTQVTAFELHEPHDELKVAVTTTLDVDAVPAERTGLSVTDAARFHDRWNEFLGMSPAVQPGEDMAGLAESVLAEVGAGEEGSVDEVGLRLGSLIHDQMTYESGSTDVTVGAEEAWTNRKGVCQDFSHLLVGALRHVGIPARYVSGYVLPDQEAPLGEPRTGESHAWVQWFNDGPNGGWFSFDPTNDTVPGELHVMVGQGREYADVVPLRGMFTGQAYSQMFVSVTMTRVK